MNIRHCSALVIFCFNFAAFAEVKLPCVISDHMVVQADIAAPIFGTSAPQEQITVELNGQKKSATAGNDGKWLVKLDPMKAGGPFELKITGKNTIVIQDVLVGEVWLASGQSNMSFPLKESTGGLEEIKAATRLNIRYLRDTGQWTVASPDTAARYSAVPYYFACELQQTLKVPVGIIDNSVGGASIEQFTHSEVLDAPEMATLLKPHHVEHSDIWNSSFVPIIPSGIRGALWCQGEGNRDFPVTYKKLLPAMIRNWRQQWGQGEFPFLIVQLTNYQARKPDPWEGKDCAMREAQLKTATSVPNTALVVTIDLGIGVDVHYPNKKPVGQRLVTAARSIAYGEKIEYSGPIFDSVKFESGKAIVSFKHVGGGLAAKGGKLTGFLLSGDKPGFVRADAKIEGDKVIVSSLDCPNPAAVRYAWERNPECNLYNEEGLPASPFRSDEFVSFYTRDNREGDD